MPTKPAGKRGRHVRALRLVVAIKLATALRWAAQKAAQAC